MIFTNNNQQILRDNNFQFWHQSLGDVSMHKEIAS